MLFYTKSPFQFAFSKELSDLNSEGDKSDSSKKFGIVGVPFDSTSTYKTGARFGPMAVREASYNFERYNMVLGRNIATEIFDFGDIEVINGNFLKTCSNIEFTISELIKMNVIPVVIGGEHTISYGVLKAMDLKNTTFIHFDAHMDLRDEYMGEKFSHATTLRRIFDLKPKKIIQIGIRSCIEDEINFAHQNHITSFSSNEVNENLEKVKNSVKNIKGPIYVSVDIDVLDPGYAPGVGTPAPCGLNPFQLEVLIHSLNGKEVVGFDVMEVSSSEFGAVTSINGAKAIYDFLCLQ
ncbi:MAG: agmatinase [Methanobacterium sp.]